MFSDLAGNQLAKTQLQRLITSARVPNSLLFAGPEGVGKKQFAFELARALVCVTGENREGCGKCAACGRAGELEIPDFEKGEEYDRVFFGSHADIGMLVPFRRNLRVNSIRALEREAYFRPYEAKARIFIVNDAEKMNDAAANALLKTLEEPAETTHIVLISSRPDSLLQTIRSRTQIIRFSPVDAAEISSLLASSHGRTADDAELAAKLSGGSIRRALDIDLGKFRQVREMLFNVLRSAADGRNLAGMLSISEQLNDAKNKDDFEQNLAILETLIHDAWLAAIGSDAELTNSDLRTEIAGIGRTVDPRRCAEWLHEIELLRENLAVNINRKIATDALFVKMAA